MERLSWHFCRHQAADRLQARPPKEPKNQTQPLEKIQANPQTRNKKTRKPPPHEKTRKKSSKPLPLSSVHRAVGEFQDSERTTSFMRCSRRQLLEAACEQLEDAELLTETLRLHKGEQKVGKKNRFLLVSSMVFE